MNATPDIDTALRDEWARTIAFHGHTCKGVAIGFAAVRLARSLLKLEARSRDEEIVCVSENDACGVDAVQAMLGCTAGKGNLLFRLRGKMAFGFFIRKTGEAVRIVLHADATQRFSTAEDLAFADLELLKAEVFDVKVPAYGLPDRAMRMRSVVCSRCGEATAESAVRLVDGVPVCLDCSPYFSRYGL